MSSRRRSKRRWLEHSNPAMKKLSKSLIGPLRLSEEAAIHPDRLGRHEGPEFARQVHDCVSDIDRQSDTAERRELRPHARVIAGFFLRAFDLDGSRRYAVYRYCVLAKFHRGDLGEHLDTALAGCVIHQVRKWDLITAGPNVHDAPAKSFHVL